MLRAAGGTGEVVRTGVAVVKTELACSSGILPVEKERTV